MSTAMIVQQASRLAQLFDIPDQGGELVNVLKATAFKGNVSDAQMSALLIVANQYALNPWTKEIYAFPDKNNGIVPVVGVDGWSRIINGNPMFDGMDFTQDDDSCTCRIYRKDRNHPIAITEYMSECKRNGIGPWVSHPKRMLRHKAMIQCSRLAFGYAGIYDLDEAERIIDSGTVYDGNTGEVMSRKEAPKALPNYADDQLEANIGSWTAAIQGGKKSADDIVAMISTRYQLSGDQIARIRSLQITHTAEAGQE